MIHKDEIEAILQLPASKRNVDKAKRAVARLQDCLADYKRFGVNLPALIESIERDIKRLKERVSL